MLFFVIMFDVSPLCLFVKVVSNKSEIIAFFWVRFVVASGWCVDNLYFPVVEKTVDVYLS